MQTKKLANALNMVGRFIHPRSPNERYRMVWLREWGGKTSVSASTPTGDIEVLVDGPAALDVCVQYSTLAGLARSFACEEVEIEDAPGVMKLETENSKLSIPSYDHAPPSIVVHDGGALYAASSDAKRCSRSLRSLSDTSELRYSHSQRLYTDEGVLRWVCSNRRAWGCSWCPSEGADLDVMIPNTSILAASECLPAEACSFSVSGNSLSIVSGDVAMLLPTETQGVAHRPYDNTATVWQNANKWEVSYSQIKEFLAQVKVFSTEFATGIWLHPSDHGLICRYTGRADGTYSPDLSVNGSCEYLVEGKCEGHPMYISSVLLSEAMAVASEENFLMHATQQGLFITADNIAWGIGALHPPQETGT